MKIITIMLIILLTSFSFAIQAHDEEKIFSWSAVTELEDGSSAEGLLTHYDLYLNNDAPIKINVPIISYIKFLPHGDYSLYVIAVVTVDGVEYPSESSNIVNFTILGELDEEDWTPKATVLRVN